MVRRIYCKLESVTISPEGEAYIIIKKDKVESLQKSVEILKPLEGQDIILTVSPLIRNLRREEK